MAKPTSAPEPFSQAAEHPIGREAALIGAFLAPMVSSGLLSLFRGSLANTSAALILALVIVAAACTGYRTAGIIAGISGGLWFDFFLTAPYLTFRVTSADDVETIIVLVLLGVAINEIIQWGRRYRTKLRERDIYLHALLSTADVNRGAGRAWIDAICRYLVSSLDLDECAWVNGVDPALPRLDRDGQVRHRGRQLPVDTDGLPTVTTVVLPIRTDDPTSPAFILTAAAHISRPGLQDRRLAGVLADHVGWALSRLPVEPASGGPRAIVPAHEAQGAARRAQNERS
jgi:hypothetical protein